MKYNAPIGAADPNDPYSDGSPGAGIEGSPVPAAALEDPQREIHNAITAAGLTPDHDDLTQLAQAIAILAAATAVRPTGFLQGFLVTNNAVDANNDVDISPGVFVSSNFTMNQAASMTKRLDAAWAAGTNNGGLDTGAKAINSTYHVFEIGNPTTGELDAIFSLNPVAPAVMPAGYTRSKRIHSVMTDGSGNIVPYQLFPLAGGGVTVRYTNHILDVNATNAPTGNTLYTLRIPSGLKLEAYLSYFFDGSNDPSSYYINDPDQASFTPSITTAPLAMAPDINYNAGFLYVYTNTSRQIRSMNPSTINTIIRICTLGYNDERI